VQVAAQWWRGSDCVTHCNQHGRLAALSMLPPHHAITYHNTRHADLPDGADVAGLVAERLAADPRMKAAALLARVKADGDYRKIQKDLANCIAKAAAAVGEGA
jgi:hypothetical protein